MSAIISIIVICTIIAILFILFGLYMFWRRHKRAQEAKKQLASQENEGGVKLNTLGREYSDVGLTTPKRKMSTISSVIDATGQHPHIEELQV